jgi:4,5:9,10-diseco-3-hydroxy-5,9,17-trioxoandrosta-1(10),2-diene-4-oate hydrolase
MTEISERVLPTGRFVEVDGHRLHLHVVGEGEPVLYLHGSGPGASGWSNFAANAEVLAAAGYQCVLLDSIGYGRSDKPEAMYTLEFMATHALGAMAALGHDRFTIVGNSHGGAQAIWLALHRPEAVARLLLMAPGGLEERETYLQMKGIRSMMRCLYGPEGLTLAGMHKLFSKQVVDPAIVPTDTIADRYEVAVAQPRHVFENMRTPNQAGELSRITAPTLALWGMDDVFCPPTGATTIASSIPGARVVLFNGCGHWVMVEKREAFDRLCRDFLDHG